MERWTRNEQLVTAGIWWAEIELREGYEFMQDFDFADVTRTIEGWLEKYPYGHNFQKYIRECFEQLREEEEKLHAIEEVIQENNVNFTLCLENFATGKVIAQCSTLVDCVEQQLLYIRQNGLGASDMDCGFGDVYKDGKLVFKIAYNGRVKDATIKDENIFLNVETGKYYTLDEQLNEIEVYIPLEDKLSAAKENSDKNTIIVATNIKWDTDGDKEVFKKLPTEIEIPKGMTDEEEISDYLSDVTGYCHFGFVLEEVAESKSKEDDFVL